MSPSELTYDGLPVFRVREPDPHRLVNEKDVRLIVPTVRVWLCRVRVRHSARA